jgi:hypothetical protein
MSDSPTFRCGCPWQYRRADYAYLEVHTPECRERSRAHALRYAADLHARYDHVNTVIIPAVPIILEDVPAPDEPDLSDVETQRPAAIPSPEMSLTMARIFASDAQPSPLDWSKICSWWLRRQAGLLGPDDQD